MNRTPLILGLAVTGLLLASAASSARADYIEDFSSPLTLSPTQAPGAWYTDRKAPAGFAAVGGELKQDIAAADLDATSFYNTQGRKYDVNLSGGTQSVSIDLFIPSAWNQAGTDRSAGLWGTGFDSSSAVSAYPIITFRNTPIAPAGIYVWDYAVAGVYQPVAAPITYDAYNTLEYRLTPGVGTTYYVNGLQVGVIPDVDTTSIGNVMLQGGNFGSNYTITWDNLAAVPEPTGVGLLALGGCALLARRGRRQK
jgi:hypothetical protein